MSYQVFARKYRPQTFDEVVGQDHIVRTLRNAIEQNRLAHAYLFVGPRGTGKTTTARIIAKALNCETGPTIKPCGVCDACKEIAAGTSLDVLEIDGASNNGVEQVRELRDNVRFAPSRGHYKIYIIDEVHMLTSQAFNALLKTLEEPPAHVKFIFATTEPQKVLPTILSRCQRFDLRRIPANLIAGHLLYIAGKENIRMDQEAADAIAKGADGGLRDAESMLDQLVAFCGDAITAADVQSVFGFTPEETTADLTDSLIAQDTPGALELLQVQVEEGRDLTKFLSDLITHLRNVLVYKADPRALRQEIGAVMMSRLEVQAPAIPSHRLLELIDLFAATEGRMKWTPNKRLHFEVALIKAIQALGQSTLTDVIETLEAMRRGDAPAVSVAPAPVKRPVAERPAERPTSKVAPVSAPAASPAATQADPEAPFRGSLTAAFEQATKPSRPTASAEPSPAPKAAPVAEAPRPAPSPAPEPAPAAPFQPAAPTPASVAVLEEPQVLIEEEEIVLEPASASPESGAVSVTAIWKEVLVGARKTGFLGMWIGYGVPISLEGNTLRVGLPSSPKLAYDTLSAESNRKEVEKLAAAAAGMPIKLILEMRDDLGEAAAAMEAETSGQSEIEDFKSDPKIKRAMEIFQAELLQSTN